MLMRMPLTALDPTAALIVIDLQKGIVGLPLAHPAAEIVARAVRLARVFRERRLPVVLVNVDAGAPGRTDLGPPGVTRAPDWAELVPELEPQPGDLRITKQRWGAFTGTTLDAELRKRGVTQVFMTGISTTRGVESTARSAYELGYNVVLVTDAMTDRNAEAHANSIERVFPSLGQNTTTAEVLEFLSARRA
jgi:nicotinamidase-related amidase